MDNPQNISSLHSIPQNRLLYYQKCLKSKIANLYGFKYQTQIVLCSKEDVLYFLHHQGYKTKFLKVLKVEGYNIPAKYLLSLTKQSKRLVQIGKSGMESYFTPKNRHTFNKIYKRHKLKALKLECKEFVDNRSLRYLEPSITGLRLNVSDLKTYKLEAMPKMKNLTILHLDVEYSKSLLPLVNWSKHFCLQNLLLTFDRINTKTIDTVVDLLNLNSSLKSFSLLPFYYVSTVPLSHWDKLMSSLASLPNLETLALDVIFKEGEKITPDVIKYIGSMKNLKDLTWKMALNQALLEHLMGACKHVANLQRLIIYPRGFRLKIKDGLFSGFESVNIKEFAISEQMMEFAGVESFQEFLLQQTNLVSLSLGNEFFKISLSQNEWTKFCTILNVRPHLEKLSLAFRKNLAHIGSEIAPLQALSSSLLSLKHLRELSIHLIHNRQILSLDYLFKAIVQIPLLVRLELTLSILNCDQGEVFKEALCYLVQLKFLCYLKLNLRTKQPIDKQAIQYYFKERMSKLKDVVIGYFFFV